MVLRWTDTRCKVFNLEPTGTRVGLLEGSQFTSRAFQLEIGDVLVMFTDGITEAENPKHELWGRSDSNPVASLPRLHTGANHRAILDEVLAFAESGSQSDDMTLVVVGVKR
jgi:sigma-B regulation protein RsbU (phosphoserine phosphatase)